MLKNLLGLLCFVFAFGQLAAQEITPIQTTDAKVGIQLLEGERLPLPELVSRQENKAVIDTLFPDIFADTCANTVTLFTTQGGGYLFGSNEFFDLEKAQLFTLPEEQTFNVTEVLVAFGEVGADIADRKVVINIYGGLPEDGMSFGEYLGSSDSVLVSDLLVDENAILFTSFPFSTPVTVTDDDFFVSVDFFDVYGEDISDDLGILSTRDGCGDGTNVFELFPTQDMNLAWNTVNANWNGLNAEMLVGVVIDDDVTSVDRRVADYGMRVFPNPAREMVTLNVNAPTAAEFTASLTDLNGRELRREVLRTVAGNGTLEWSVEDLPNGLYLYHLDGPEGRQSGKLMIGN
ncbi:T9SS type A sorting domain-containing protein [Lewinella sp. W8]|uniref:T9SS type A sorting domain-containing protein n=1 Tax=Lewinella sp. W8 TaxID=2528208 RepID=UPI001068947E|nr:T9SS type A sorting domain-containing protein [Lewinella sp. W8]MTB50204.1 T9SS type A sorting domain-containing protein [Lewinella sp. W8]